jgi:hypothetical protein
MKKVFWGKLKNPSGWILILVWILTMVFIGGALGVLFVEYEGTFLEIVAYFLFALSAVFLAYSVYLLIIVIPTLKERITGALKSNPLTAKVLEDYGFRTVLFSGVSLGVSVLYSLYNGVLSVWFHSMWYGALAAYYITLVCLRSGIVFYHGKRRGKNRDAYLEIRKYRNCGWLLLSMISALSAAVLYMVRTGSGFVHAGLTIYVFATYTFYKITMSIINILKAKRQEDFTVKAVRCVNLADAAVSILALQTAMLLEFSDGTGMVYANAIMGAIVCTFVAGLGVMMIVKGGKQLRKIKTKEDKICVKK